MKKRAFTLIEVLVVITILGTLSATILPRIGDAREETKKTMSKVDESRKLAREIDFDGYTFSSDSAWGGTQNLGNWVHYIWNDITVCREWNCITMQDRNLWATSNDTNSVDSYWYHYQRWNNHEFKIWCWTNPCSDTITNNATTDRAKWENIYNNHWYDWEIDNFMKWTDDYWDEDKHYDWLRWWEYDSDQNNWWLDLNNPEDRKWPCPNWYHVPSAGEWWAVLKYWAANYTWAGNSLSLNINLVGTSIGLPFYKNNSTAANQFNHDFKIALAGYRDTNAQIDELDEGATLWTSTSKNGKNYWSRFIYLLPTGYSNYSDSRASAGSIRCFKN